MQLHASKNPPCETVLIDGVNQLLAAKMKKRWNLIHFIGKAASKKILFY